MIRLMRPLTMIATCSATAVATPMFCSMTQDRHVAFLGERDQHLARPVDDDRRQALGRLVHDQQPRIAEQRAGDRQHLLLAAGELRAAIAAALGEPRKGLVDALDRPGRSRPSRGGEPQMLVDGQAPPDAAALRHVADAEPVRSRAARAPEISRPARRIEPLRARFSPMIVLQSVVLPMPLRPTIDRMPLVERQVDALDGVRLAVVDLQVADPERSALAAGSRSAMAASEIDLLHLGIVLDLLAACLP